MIELILAAVVSIKSEASCLAHNIYHEARGEPIIGQIAVAHVTLNRVKDKHFPNTICGVVKQSKQFSWYKGTFPKPNDQESFERAYDIAQLVTKNKRRDPTYGSIMFHAKTDKHGNNLQPYWATSPTLKKTVTIGKHIFYRRS